MKKHIHGLFILLIITLAVCTYGIALVGSPMTQKSINEDRLRVADIDNLQRAVGSYFSDYGFLPESLDMLAQTNIPSGNYPYLKPIPKDPATKEAYEYIMKGNVDFDICTTFTTDSQEIEKQKNKVAQDPYYGPAITHPKGYYCVSANAQEISSNTPASTKPLKPIAEQPESGLACGEPCTGDSECASGYCYQPPAPKCDDPALSCAAVMPAAICRERACEIDAACGCARAITIPTPTPTKPKTAPRQQKKQPSSSSGGTGLSQPATGVSSPSTGLSGF